MSQWIDDSLTLYETQKKPRRGFSFFCVDSHQNIKCKYKQYQRKDMEQAVPGVKVTLRFSIYPLSYAATTDI